MARGEDAAMLDMAARLAGLSTAEREVLGARLGALRAAFPRRPLRVRPPGRRQGRRLAGVALLALALGGGLGVGGMALAGPRIGLLMGLGGLGLAAIGWLRPGGEARWLRQELDGRLLVPVLLWRADGPRLVAVPEGRRVVGALPGLSLDPGRDPPRLLLGVAAEGGDVVLAVDPGLRGIGLTAEEQAGIRAALAL
ncbi:hypothetical protein [Neoroseomonas oryzicola]|uniref:Uncharacterized protein n=1 Tax=Neoroseomonas oryzicola TaxID=535904 RepID=A0A9X9WH47_9PROT|nr:hypothetical protein [Neoroseomonas oryzicola]MBR0659657.1 hypothetical protein [Neoroseomonas oryzicola]NKE15482.1 hypothetical protein [Neoroseomonas oryzicola]